MECNKECTIKAGTSHTYIGCDEQHVFNKDLTFECSQAYTFTKCLVGNTKCLNNHMWKCKECSEKIPSGKTLQHSPLKCTKTISVDINDNIRFSHCNHPANIKRTWVCGTIIDYKDCEQVSHIIKCESCFECANEIVIQEVSEEFFPPDCLVKHMFGPATYKCGQEMNFTDCSKNHYIKCRTCGGQFTPLNTSTPKIDKNEKIILDETSKNLAETNKKVRKALQDIDDENCNSAHHDFETRTRKFLSAPARQFMNAYRACLYNFSRSQNPISKQFGDGILQKLIDSFNELQKVRQYCLEPFTDEEISDHGYDAYMNEKFDLYNEALRLHDQYFNAHIIEQESFQRSTTEQTKAPFLIYNSLTKPQPKVPQPTGLINKFSNLNFNESKRAQIPASPEPFVPIIHRDPHQYVKNTPFFKFREELLNVKKFNASEPRKYMAFRAQWQNYINKADQAKRSEIDKYYDLINVLEGKAHDLVQTDYPHNDSYKIAINSLDEMYYHPANLLRDMSRRVSKISKMSDSYQSLLEGTINLRQAWADLNHANLTVEQLKGLYFITSTEKNLSEGAWKAWLEIQNEPKFSTDAFACFDISNYMQSINTAMLNAQRKENALGKPALTADHNKFKPRPQQSTLYGSYNLVNKTPEKGKWQSKFNNSPQKQARINGCCVFCNKKPPHMYQLQCKELRKLNSQDIWKIMKKYGIDCKMCLALGHTTLSCEASNSGRLKPCNLKVKSSVCGKFHCRYLHQFYEKPVTNLTISNENVEQSQD